MTGHDKAIIILGSMCMANAALYVISDLHKSQKARSLSKLAAGTAYVALAVQNGAIDSTYGRLILLANNLIPRKS